jgi:DNA primase
MRILTAILLRHPALWHDVAQAYAGLPLDPRLSRLRDAMEACVDSVETLDSAHLIDQLTKSGLELDVAYVLAEAPMPLPAYAASSAMPAEAESGWWHIFGFLNVEHLREEVALAGVDAGVNWNDATVGRLTALRKALIKVETGEPDGVGSTDAFS